MILDVFGGDDVEPTPPPYRPSRWSEFTEELDRLSEDVQKRHWDVLRQHGATDDDGTILVLLITPLVSNLFMNAVLGDEMASEKDREIAGTWLDEH